MTIKDYYLPRRGGGCGGYEFDFQLFECSNEEIMGRGLKEEALSGNVGEPC